MVLVACCGAAGGGGSPPAQPTLSPPPPHLACFAVVGDASPTRPRGTSCSGRIPWGHLGCLVRRLITGPRIAPLATLGPGAV